MNSNSRTTVLAAAAAAALALVAAGPAQATGDHGEGKGRASAVVLRTGLDVSLLNKTVNAPLTLALNEVHAPASAQKTALTAELEGVDHGRPFSVLRADVATARATAEKGRAEGYSNVAHAKVHVPGLPLLSLIEVDQVTSKAVCAAGRRPVAESNLLGSVTVLGKRVTLSAGGTTQVEVPGVGEVRLDLSRTSTTSRTAAAAALELEVSVNPLKLNVAEVEGTVTLAGATCTAPPETAPEPKPEPEPEDEGPKAQGKAAEPVAAKAAEPRENLAETGGDSRTPYLAGGAALLLVTGGAAVAVSRRARNRA
ncbi:SCO1860 family LAETG-anchored protein [Streptomyces sp. NPDC059009]|uniref:SCO1860 family LAETG-anchored protein n=1 Tax=Streptomyces sp. NPDC059009 TaxID=3346694 RepID=UPI003692C9C1